MSEKIAMAYDQTYGKPHSLLGDDALSGSAAGFDDDLAHLFAKKILKDMAEKGFGPKPEYAAAMEKSFCQAFRKIDPIIPAG